MLSGLIWVQTVCKDYQQMTLVGRVNPMAFRMVNTVEFKSFSVIGLTLPTGQFCMFFFVAADIFFRSGLF